MAVSRRKFLKAGTLVSLSAVIHSNGVMTALAQSSGTGPEGLFRVPDGIQSDSYLTEELFSRYVNTQFQIYTTILTAIDIELVDVKRWEAKTSKHGDQIATQSPERESFSVVFRGPRKVALESKTYRISHLLMGSFDLFISPVNDRKKERLYQAVFNRFKP